MSETPDPQVVREIARDCAADYLGDARDIAAHVMGHFGIGVPGDVYAWTEAVRTELSAAVVSWPDEQPQDERDAGYCAHCRRDLTGASVHTIQGIAVCADIRHCLARQSRFAERIAELDAREAKATAPPQQPAPEPCDGDCDCDCDCQPGQPCLCPERDCYCGPCRVCGENPQQPEPERSGT